MIIIIKYITMKNTTQPQIKRQKIDGNKTCIKFVESNGNGVSIEPIYPLVRGVPLKYYYG
ncbi:MAG: hypothetical protein CMP54_03995 [Flavobacteriales bacterium]|nr:hypothetical protein [Flavobacteriales bacterium]